jgi:hypothetical protein
MRHKMKLILLLASAALVVTPLMGGTTTSAQSSGGSDLTWTTIDGGGATVSAGGAFTLGGSIGQADAGAPLSGGSYSLRGGFWGGVSIGSNLYLPLVLRG